MALNTIDFNKLALRKGDRLLDVGSGLGRHSLIAFRDYPVEVVGVDLGFDDLLEANKRVGDIRENPCQGEILFAQGSGYALPLESESFERVICCEVLEHVDDYPAMIKELIRVLKPGGYLALSVPKYFPERLCWLFSEDYPAYAGHVRIFKKNQLKQRVLSEGLSFREEHSAHAIHSPYWWLRSMFFKKGEKFWPVQRYQAFLDWELYDGPNWLRSLESWLNPLIGKSNIYYFEKPDP